jgi:uncharacterized protein (DUF342 family)
LSDISVQYTSDGFRAFLQISPEIKSFPSLQELKRYLQNNGIIYGVNENVLQDVALGRHIGDKVEIARGTAVAPGIPGRIEYLINIDERGRPKELSDGRVDHHNLNFLINVKKGDPLAKRIPPKPGTEGKTIFGKVVPAPPVTDVKLQNGCGTAVSAQNPDLLIAVIDGAVSLDQQGRMEVRNEKIIRGDIDYSTGNLIFKGNLQICGTVRTGFSVEICGKLSIEGNVEDAKIKCTEALEIRGGAVGAGNGNMECNSLKIRFVENFTIKAENDIIVSEDIVNSIISTSGKVKAKSIIGGTITASEIEADALGSIAESRTIADIGRKQALISERSTLKKELDSVSQKLSEQKEKLYLLIRDNMDESGSLGTQVEVTLESFRRMTVQSYDKYRELVAKLEQIDKLIAEQKAETSILAGHIYPNTFIRLGNSEKFILEEMDNVKFTAG